MTCAEVAIQDSAAWAAVLPPGADRSSLPEMAVTITVSPMLEETERRKVLRRALVRMLQGFGYIEADEHLFT
ncbi:hypothetical protein [Streptomyces sp900105755]|uniref:Uncharacterized protein n=1 Tax=Streptomyces sp. 900105755 TaxID=3154389 RepID=A0ABV1TY49_9ACTN